MKHIHTFENFLNEDNNADLLNEGKQVFVSDPKFKDETTLKADILKNVGPAINDLLARQGVKYHPITAKENRGRIEFDSKPMTGNDLGFMQYGFTEVWLNTFGGGNFPQIQKATAEDGSDFEFSPYIWFNLHYDYKHVGGGSNGCELRFSGERSSNIFYDVIAGKFLTDSEAEKRKDWQ